MAVRMYHSILMKMYNNLMDGERVPAVTVSLLFDL
jgi:hypothetical protein